MGNMNQTQPTKTTPRIVVRRDSTTGKRVTSIQGDAANDPVKLAERLFAVLQATRTNDGSRLFFVTFAQVPDRVLKKTLITNIEVSL